MAFYKFTGTTAEYYPSIGLTAQPGYVYDFGSDSPPNEPILIDAANAVPGSKWTSDPGPATDFALRGRQASDLSTSYAVATTATTTAKAKVQITDNCYAANGSVVSVTAGTARFPYTVGMDACDLQLEFANYNSPTATPVVDTDPGTSITFGAAVEDASGVVFPLTFNGARQATIGGGGSVKSDNLPIEVTKGSLIFVRVFLSSGSFYTNRVAINSANAGGFTATTDLTPNGSAAVTQAGFNGWGPTAILGTPMNAGTPRSWVLIGDSRGLGAQDGQFSLYSGYYPTKPWMSGGGWFLRAMSGQGGVINLCQSGDQQQWFNANAGHYRRSKPISYARYAMLANGINDLNSGSRTPAQLQQDLLTQATRNLARGIVKNVVHTLAPYSTSTDLWLTVVNQTTVGTNANRVAHNTWVRDGGPIDPITLAPVATGTVNALRFGATKHPIAGYVEVADAVESSRNSGLWKGAFAVVNDCAMTSAAFTATSATANFSTAVHKGMNICVVGAGSAGGNLYTEIDSVTNATTIATRDSAATTVSGAQLIIGPYTKDGLHELVIAAAAEAAAVQSSLLAFG